MNSSGSAKPSAKGILDHHRHLRRLSSNQGGKHDYDWRLLTPPDTSLIPSSNGKKSQPNTNSRTRPSIDHHRIIRPAPTHSFSVGARPITLPNEVPPNLVTCLPVSARPGPSMTVKGTINTAPRGRLARAVEESVTRKPVKVLSSESGTRSILKKSLHMAIKHIDIRSKGVRPLPGSTLFPHTIRSTQPSTATATARNNVNSKNGTASMDNKVKPVTVQHKTLYSSKLERVDVYESLRYDSIFLKEDLKNTSWLHGVDEKSDQSLLFDNGFETLPEPFAP